MTIRRTLFALLVAPWAGVAFVSLFSLGSFRYDLRVPVGVSLMLAAYGYLAEAVFALPILLIWKGSRSPGPLLAAVWASLGASGTIGLIFVTAALWNAMPPSELWLAVTPKIMWPYWVAGALSGLTYVLIVRWHKQ